MLFSLHFSVILWIRSSKSFGDSKMPLGDVWDVILEAFAGRNWFQNDPKWVPRDPHIGLNMKNWTKSMFSHHFKWPGSMMITHF